MISNPHLKKEKPGRKKNRGSRKSAVVKGAENRLKKFRQSTVLAVAVTGFILLLFSGGDLSSMEEQAFVGQNDTIEIHTATVTEPGTETEKAADEAIGALQNMWNSFTFNYPKILIAIACLVLAWLLTWLIKLILRRSFRRLKSIDGITTLVAIVIWALAIGVVIQCSCGRYPRTDWFIRPHRTGAFVGTCKLQLKVLPAGC